MEGKELCVQNLTASFEKHKYRLLFKCLIVSVFSLKAHQENWPKQSNLPSIELIAEPSFIPLICVQNIQSQPRKITGSNDFYPHTEKRRLSIIHVFEEKRQILTRKYAKSFPFHSP